MINEYFADPFSSSLKWVFKLKWVWGDDKSCDSSSLMTKLETKDEETFENEERSKSLETEIKHVNEGL